MSKSLEQIVKSLNDFSLLEKVFGEDGFKPKTIELLKKKGYYPYEYVKSIKELLKELPSNKKIIVKSKNKTLNIIDKSHPLYKYILKWYNYRKVSVWYSHIQDKDITKEEYEHVKKV